MSEATFYIRAVVSNALGIASLLIANKPVTTLNAVLLFVTILMGSILYWGSKEVM